MGYMANLKRSAKRKYRRIPKLVRSLIRWFLIGLAAVAFDFALLLVVTLLTSMNLIDWKVVVSFLVVEVLAAVLAKLFRIGGPSETEEKNQKIALAASRAQFSHLKIVSLENEGHNIDYPDSHYRVLNTKTKVCYWVPSYLESLVEEETIFDEITLKNEGKWENYLKENGIRDGQKFPSVEELEIGKTEATQDDEESLYRAYIT